MTSPPVQTLNTADLVVLTIRDDRLKVLLVVRGKDPYRGRLAFPGGFLRLGEDLDATAHRELAEETGLDGRKLPLQQLHTYSGMGRDPRGQVVTTAYLAIAPNLPTPVGASDAVSADWYEVDDSLPRYLAFDHWTILSDAIEKVRADLERTPLATAFCSDTFTISELRRVYELVWNTTIDAGNFRRKVVEVINGFVESTGQKRQNPDGGRPAELYRQGTAKVLHPPYPRPMKTGPA